jgi:hypothetical protein
VVSSDAVIRLPLFDFPGMEVKINGKVIKHINNDCRGEEFCLGLITFNLPVGEYLIETELKDTPVRRIGNYLTIAGFTAIIWLIIKKNEKTNK